MTAERVRRLGELAVPGFAIGVTAGLIAGGLSLLAGQPAGWALASLVTLGVPLAIFGGGYGVLMARGVFKPGVFATAGLYWLVAFPVARLSQEAGTSTLVSGAPHLREDLLSFLAYQGLVSLGFAIGFVWMHERVTPHWLMRIQDRNPDARLLLERYVQHAEMLWRAKQARRAARAARRGRTGPPSAGASSGARAPAGRGSGNGRSGTRPRTGSGARGTSGTRGDAAARSKGVK
ncbi:hypothetical protein HNP84_007726 [Thermocatellispora tengchongensis]|uniref:Uncharacterized protein n=1 Tax=Thermocatellispora tengchongensis TaxID=1073253 RepID=A0A840PJ83_9ACTN|nr:hypothetical protein [Thermocatellispora tengchongensis]MBB5137973.1 hypothetical protein [Thermocatellispora tengchongensis]